MKRSRESGPRNRNLTRMAAEVDVCVFRKEEKMSENISRRGFLGGAVASALAVGASSLVMGSHFRAYANESVNDDIKDVVGRDFPERMRTEPIEPVAPPATWDDEADVVVVGAGGGMAAAARAVEQGHKVILIDKRPDTGGGSKEASAFVAPGTKVQEALGMPDVSDKLLGASLASAPFGSRYAAYTTNVVESAKRLVNWTVDQGFAWQPTTVTGGAGPVALSPAGSEEGGMTARAMSYLFDFLEKKYLDNGGDLRLKTEAVALVKDGDRVVGIKVKDWNGKEAYIKANNGVLLATGGMAANRPLLKKYIPTCYECAKFSTAGTQDTGDGILMGLGAGANFAGFDTYDRFDGGVNGVDWNTHMYAAAVQIVRQPWLGIDINGERYPYFEGSFNEFTAAAKQLESLPGHQGYVFFDNKYEEYGPTFHQNMCRLLIDEDTMPDAKRLKNSIVNNNWRDGVKKAVDDGLVVQGDTIAEVAEKLGMDPAKAEKAVEEWNKICAEGTDPEGKMPDEFLHPIEQGPFYGAAIGSFVFSTHAGLAVDDKGEVLDTKGNPIPGLYASGNTVGYPMAQANGSCCFSSATANLAVESMFA